MQSSSQSVTTNKPTPSFFTGQIPFLLPNQQCQSTEGKISHSLDSFTPSSPGVFQLLSLTTNSSWLPGGRVAMPLISPLTPVPQKGILCILWRPRAQLVYFMKRDKTKKIKQIQLMDSLMCDNTVNLHPFWLNAIAVVAFLQIMRVVFRHACFMSWTTETAAVFQCRWLIHVEPSFECLVSDELMYFKLHFNTHPRQLAINLHV